MKIVIASDSYKGSLSSMEVADSIEKGIRKLSKDAQIIKIPIADGGEGTVDALVSGACGTYEEVEVLDPLGRKIRTQYGIINDNIAVLEMASASGLTLINKDERNPLITTTFGTGQLIKTVLDKGYRKIYIGLGGSATNDGGIGMAQALGVSFKDTDGKELGFGGGELSKLVEIDINNMHPGLKSAEITIISDVANPLCGEKGASMVYGPQKGASKEIVEILDSNLLHYSKIIKEKIGIEIKDVVGAGAAGGLGAGLIAFCNANISSGIDTVLDLLDIDKHLLDTDLIITGEGQLDGQSIYGKVPVGVAKRGKKYNIPVVAMVGSVGEGASEVYSYGIDGIIDIINRPMTLDYAIENAPLLVEKAAENLMRILSIHIK